jgi:hypothetical protein
MSSVWLSSEMDLACRLANEPILHLRSMKPFRPRFHDLNRDHSAIKICYSPVLMWYVLLRLHVLDPCDPSHGSIVLTLSVKGLLFVSSE